jgi:hypothetical protein
MRGVRKLERVAEIPWGWRQVQPTPEEMIERHWHRCVAAEH